MVDIDFLKKYLSFDLSIPFLERGDVLPLELIEWLQESQESLNIKNIYNLIRPGSQEAKHIYITLRCPTCGETFAFPSSKSNFAADITNQCQEYISTTAGKITHRGSRLCSKCLELFLNEQEKLIEEERIRLRKIKEEEKAERERKCKENDHIIDQYFETAPDDFQPSIEDYLDLEHFINDVVSSHTGHLKQKLNELQDSSLIHSRYWAIISNEVIRRTRSPKCVLTSRTEKLVALPEDGALYDVFNRISNYPLVSIELVDKYGISEIRKMIRVSSFSSYASYGSSSGYMRTYKMYEKIEFGKYKGETINDIMLYDKSYLEFIHGKNPSFNIVDSEGNYLFDYVNILDRQQ